MANLRECKSKFNAEVILKTILDNSYEIVFLTDENLKILCANFELEKILETTDAYLQNKSLLEFIDQKDIDKKIQKHSGEPIPVTFISTSGTKYDYLLKFVKQKGYFSDNTTGILWFGINQEEINVKRFQEQLIRLERMAGIGNLAAGIIHELKNPLAIINQAAGWGKVLVEDNIDKLGNDGEELEKVFEEIVSQTLRCSDITNELLNFVRETKNPKRSFKVLNLIENSLKLLKSELKSPRIKVEKVYAHNVNEIEADFRLLEQVLINIISNAIYAIREKNIQDGHIKIQTYNDDDFLTISIKDNGIGIPEQKQKKDF